MDIWIGLAIVFGSLYLLGVPVEIAGGIVGMIIGILLILDGLLTYVEQGTKDNND